MSNPPPPPEWQPGPPPPWQQSGQPVPPMNQQPPPYTAMPQQPAPKKGGVNWVALIVLVVVGGIAGAFFLFRDQLSGGVTDLRVGDCFEKPGNEDSISEIQHRPCNQAHYGEVFHNATHSGASTYPTRDEFFQLVLDQCTAPANAYLGTDFSNRPDLDVGYFYPTSSSWADGDRGITCYFYNIDETNLTASLKNAGAGGTTLAPTSTP